MQITIDIPTELERTLRRALGDDLSQAVKEALAMEAYRTGALSLGQFAEMIGVSTYEADGLLKQRGIMLDIDVAEFEEELASLKALIGG